jgi:hypothetical protein
MARIIILDTRSMPRPEHVLAAALIVSTVTLVGSLQDHAAREQDLFSAAIRAG